METIKTIDFLSDKEIPYKSLAIVGSICILGELMGNWCTIRSARNGRISLGTLLLRR